MVICRPPCHALRPFVMLLWAEDSTAPAAPIRVERREHVLPTGHMHLVLRFGGPQVRVWRDGAESTPLPRAVIGGARSVHYVREPSPAGNSVGAQLRPGAAVALFGAPADLFSNRHVALSDVCGDLQDHWMEQLEAAPDAPARLAVWERLLWQHLRRAQTPHPAVLRALSMIGAGGSVEQAVNQTGYSHRHLLTLFRQATGLSPKTYARLARLQGVLRSLHRDRALGWAEAADAAGYSDQSHFNREFRAYSGLTPTEWRRAWPAHPNHVPLPPAR